MRKRNCRIEIYFTPSELENLTKKVCKSGLSREGYCRRILNGSVVKEAPPAPADPGGAAGGLQH